MTLPRIPSDLIDTCWTAAFSACEANRWWGLELTPARLTAVVRVVLQAQREYESPGTLAGVAAALDAAADGLFVLLPGTTGRRFAVLAETKQHLHDLASELRGLGP